MNADLLSLAIWVPIVAGLLVLAAGGERNAPAQRWIALIGALLGFAVTIPLYTGFDLHNPGMQFVQNIPWIERFHVNYHLGVDGISVLFVLLNSFITILVVIAGWSVVQSRVSQYYASFLILSGLMNGVFAALDGVLFYVFFEATLIPMFIIIGVWGGPNRVYAALTFFLYTLAGSLLLLVALLYLYNKSGGSFEILDWHNLPLPLGVQILLFFGFLLASWSMVRNGISWGDALKAAAGTETASITSMEIVDSAFLLLIPGAMHAYISSPLYWYKLVAALIVAFLITVPVNRHLISRNPHKYHHHHT